MLPEVLQQQARLDDPQAAARRDFIRWAPCKALLHHWPLDPVQVLLKPASLAGPAHFSVLLTGVCSLCRNPIRLVTLS